MEQNPLEERLRGVELQLARLVSHLDSEQGTANRQYEHVNRALERCEHAIYGNGQEGLKARVATLEQSDRRRDQRALAFWPALLALVGKAIWDIVHQ